jgi:hypothetical protein
MKYLLISLFISAALSGYSQTAVIRQDQQIKKDGG